MVSRMWGVESGSPREPLDPAWVEDTFDQVNVLVLEDDAKGLADKVAELSTARTPPVIRVST